EIRFRASFPVFRAYTPSRSRNKVFFLFKVSDAVIYLLFLCGMGKSKAYMRTVFHLSGCMVYCYAHISISAYCCSWVMWVVFPLFSCPGSSLIVTTFPMFFHGCHCSLMKFS